jgi:hypothetical protein
MNNSILLFIAIVLVVVLIHPLFAEAILPPLKQLKSGIIAINVQCADNMYLTLSPIENRMACVTIETAQKLAERGWQSFIPQTSDKAASVLKQCHDSTPIIDYVAPDNKTDDSVNPEKSYSNTFWWTPLNSTVKLCMKYYSFFDDVYVPIHILKPNIDNYTQSMVVKASQGTISKGTTIVSYEFNTGNQKGRYLMAFDCGESPIVIGSDASELNRTDFPLVQKYSCPAWGSYNYTVVGTSGIYEKYFK